MRAQRLRFGVAICLAAGMVGGVTSTGKSQKLKAATLLPTQGFVGYVVTRDFNGDGIPDLIYSEARDNVAAIAVQFGNGDGTFQPAVLTKLPAYNSTLGCCGGYFTLADVNGDGVPDAIFGGTNFSQSVIVVLLGNRDGSFGAEQVSAMNLDTEVYSGVPTADSLMAVADWNGDGHVDVAFTDSIEGTVGIALGDGAGKFTQVKSYFFSLDDGLEITSAADLNGDGRPDFIVGGNSLGGVGIFLNAGGGAFTSALMNTPYNSYSHLLADVNGDGKIDLIYAGAVLPNYVATISLALGNGDGTFQTATPVVPYAANVMRVAQLIDLDGDGKADLLLNTSDGAAYLSGDGKGGFSGLKEISMGPVDLDANTVAADINSDGKNDLIASGQGNYNAEDSETGGLILAVNQGNGTFNTADLYDAVSPWYSGLLGDFNNDGVTDVLTYTSGLPTVFFGDRSGVLKPLNVASIPAEGNPNYAYAGDVNGDGKLDLVENTESYNPTLWAAGNGDGTFAPGQTVPGTSESDILESVVTVQDFNQDGIADILLFSEQTAQTLDLGSKMGPQNSVSVSSAQAGGTYVDLNGDGVLDHVFSTSAGVNVELGISPTQFAMPAIVLNAPLPSVTVADADGDGKLDLIVSYQNPDNTLINEISYGDGDGTFGSPSVLSLPSRSSVQAVADMNLDGYPDLLLTDYDYLYLMHGIGSRKFEANPARYPSATVTTAVSVGDFNGDGSPDVYLINSTNSFVVHLNRGGVWTTLTADPNPQIYGQGGIQISATVAESVPESGTPSGIVKVSVDNASLGTITLAGGTGQIADNSLLSVGSHTLAAQYPGDGNFNPKSFSGTEVVNKAATTTNLTATPLSIVAGESVTLAATVAPEFSGIPTGTVTFDSGTTQVGSGTLNGSAAASATATGLTAGNYRLTANYGGDGNFLASTSAAQAVAVTDFSVAAAPASLTATAGGTAKTTVTVSPVNGFNGAVNLSCTGTTEVTCAFSPANLSVPGAAATSTLTLTAAVNSAAIHGHGREWMVLAVLLPVGMLRRRWLGGVMLSCCLLATFLTGCGGSGGGGGGGGGGKTMTYTVTVQATYAADTTITRTSAVTVVVTQ